MCLAQRHLEVEALARHLGQDIVSGTVDDAHDFVYVVGIEAFLERADDGDHSTHCALELDVYRVGRSGCEDIVAVTGDHLLVGGDHRFTGSYRVHDELHGRLEAADSLGDYVDLGIVYDLVGIGSLQLVGDCHVTGPVPVHIGDTFDRDRAADTLDDAVGIFRQHLIQAGAYYTETEDTDTNWLQVGHELITSDDTAHRSGRVMLTCSPRGVG